MIEFGFSGGRFAMQNFMKAEILQGKSLNPLLYLQEPLKYTHVTLRPVLALSQFMG